MSNLSGWSWWWIGATVVCIICTIAYCINVSNAESVEELNSIKQ